MQDGGGRTIRRVNVVHDEQQGALSCRRRDRLQEGVRQPQRGDFRRPIHRLRDARKGLKYLRIDPGELAQRFGVRSPDRPLGRQLADQLGEDGERQLALGVVGLRARDDGPLHLTAGGKSIGERGLPHPRVAGDDDNTGGTAPHVHPGVVQPAELALPADEELAFEPPWRQLRDGLFSDTGDRKSTRLNSSHLVISYAVFCLKKKSETIYNTLTRLRRSYERPHSTT